MTIKNKIILILITIFTLGFFWIFYFQKKKNKKKSNELSRTTKIPFSIKKLVHAIGENNIIKSEYTHTKIKIFVHSPSKINMEEIKKIKTISGTLKTSTSITLIVGNSAQALSTNITKFIESK